MTFEDYQKGERIRITPTKNRQRQRQRSTNSLQNLNSHINFKRESKKTNARKDLTEVTCIQCKTKFTLPFKPRKPEIYCNDCFKKNRSKRRN